MQTSEIEDSYGYIIFAVLVEVTNTRSEETRQDGGYVHLRFIVKDGYIMFLNKINGSDKEYAKAEKQFDKYIKKQK